MHASNSDCFNCVLVKEEASDSRLCGWKSLQDVEHGDSHFQIGQLRLLRRRCIVLYICAATDAIDQFENVNHRDPESPSENKMPFYVEPC